MKTKYFISEDSINELVVFLRNIDFSSIFVLVDDKTEKLCYPTLRNNIRDINEGHIIKIPSGEGNKILINCIKVWEKLIEKNSDRNSLLINLGGGMITDIGGFIASTFKRGINYINVPTTLLAMIDASIGGKTGINFMNYKNQIGTFYKPMAVFVYTGFLKTLDTTQMKSGFGEIIKYALISDNKLWNQLINSNIHSYEISEKIIRNCIRIKKEYVDIDPTEMNVRRVLNFGHTVGHALETLYIEQNKTELCHGSAVANGIIVESIISRNILSLSQDELNSIIKLIRGKYSQITFTSNDIDFLIKIMQHDKKNFNNSINFTLLKHISVAKIDNYLQIKDIEVALLEYLRL